MDPITKAQAENNQRVARFGDKARTFKPGQSGNPGGRPKTAYITREMKRLARKKEGQELIQSVMTDILKKRGMAAVLLLREMGERLEGKVTQPVEMSGELTLTLADAVREGRERREAMKLLPNASSAA